ncbi:hypothetical protein Q765_15125 [Flavobacterium rivuli WB 3.3-2 = DSM 21788]|uniref:Lipocalin-like domain-containing protein n=1 Tax=Flavobacterium rivuli WB 3.3-2 = DSM 21788 TaxID=1121895 RepID=A0A0A2LZ69_9FLAO|nr:hypothetical protein [Flavobacterium rivuli]KGO85647.1 hypothetical protein Q765_15125 [Flavobacterium rivuli WB 3.3-2 = DSM 21788]
MKQFLLPISLCLLLASCAKEQKETTIKKVSDTIVVTKAAPETIKETVLQNTVINPKYNPESLYGIWTLDNNGPHADFELTKKSFYVVDHDGDGNMPYTLKHDTLTVMYADYKSTGVIKKVVKDTMVINWDNTSDVVYITWKG